jgi:hypothetical protein
MKKATKYVLQIQPNATYRKYKEFALPIYLW